MIISSPEVLLPIVDMPPTPDRWFWLYIAADGSIGVSTSLWFDSRAFDSTDDITQIDCFALERGVA